MSKEPSTTNSSEAQRAIVEALSWAAIAWWAFWFFGTPFGDAGVYVNTESPRLAAAQWFLFMALSSIGAGVGAVYLWKAHVEVKK